jgi:hypothetical protein
MVHSNKKRWQPKLICIIDSFIERNKVWKQYLIMIQQYY